MVFVVFLRVARVCTASVVRVEVRVTITTGVLRVAGMAGILGEIVLSTLKDVHQLYGSFIITSSAAIDVCPSKRNGLLWTHRIRWRRWFNVQLTTRVSAVVKTLNPCIRWWQWMISARACYPPFCSILSCYRFILGLHMGDSELLWVASKLVETVAWWVIQGSFLSWSTSALLWFLTSHTEPKLIVCWYIVSIKALSGLSAPRLMLLRVRIMTHDVLVVEIESTVIR